MAMHLGKNPGFMDPFIKAKGVQNAYFPLFIPESFLKRKKNMLKVLLRN
jgi:hypothetical protein